MLGESIRLALGRLRANRLRSALTILGIVIGIAAVVSLVSLGAAVRADIDQNFAGLGVGTVTVQPGAEQTDADGGELGGRLVPGATTVGAPLTNADVDAIAELPGTETVAPVSQTAAEVTVDGETAAATLIASVPQLADTESFTLAAGSFMTDLAEQERLPVAVIGADLATELGIDSGDVGTDITIDARTYAVLGVLEPQGGIGFVNPDDGVIVPLSTAEGNLIDRDPEYDMVRVAAVAGAETGLADGVTDALLAERAIDDADDADFSVVEATSLISVAEDTSSLLTQLVSAVGAISLVVGAVGIANMMLVAVRERTREIGVRRAVGATRRDITTQFLSESVVLSVLGGIIGAVLGVVLSTILAEQLLATTAVVSQSAVALALVVSGVVGMLAGLGPAWQAASVDPTEALRYE